VEVPGKLARCSKPARIPGAYTRYERIEQIGNPFPGLRDERIAVPPSFVFGYFYNPISKTKLTGGTHLSKKNAGESCFFRIFKINVVEVPGFEPGSGNLNLIVSTCLVYL